LKVCGFASPTETRSRLSFIMCKNGPLVNTKYTWEEVKKHNTPEDAWVVYFNKVYDVSNW